MSRIFWSLLCATAVLWPGRLAGPLDGAPLDHPLEAIVLGLFLPFLLVSSKTFTQRRAARLAIVLLLSWKAATSAVLTQDGWCVQFTTAAPLYLDEVTVPHSWDVRADWRSATPRCSAVMAGDLARFERWPVWFLNFPTDDKRPPDQQRPPNVTLGVALSGSIAPSSPGTFRLLTADDVQLQTTIDGVAVSPEALMRGVPVGAGAHTVEARGQLVRSNWSLAARWNDEELWHAVPTTIAPAATLDRGLRPWGRWLQALFALSIVLLGLFELLRDARSVTGLATCVALCALMFLISGSERDAVMRGAPLVLLAAAVVRWPGRWRNGRGFLWLVAVPTLALFAAIGAPRAGLFTMYSAGDDWWLFQRFSYLIYLQGHWLEGGEKAFWFQPFYRWIAGGLHMIFGDSSIGEVFWDAGALVICSAYAFRVARRIGGFRWGLVASVVTLALFTLGPGWYLIGRGLSEFTSAGLMCVAALLMMAARRSAPLALAAGGAATFAFFTRLNNLPMAIASVIFALPSSVKAADVWTPSRWWRRLAVRVALIMLATVAIGLFLFALRTWYYTGVFSVLHGTQAGWLSLWYTSREGDGPLSHVVGSVLMVLTMNDPPRVDPRAIPIVLGVVVSLLAMLRVPRFRELPLNATALCLSSIAGALVARGSAYPGRFSLHVVPVAVAIACGAVALVLKPTTTARETRSAD